MLAYPLLIASYAVSVRQYQILQSRFLQCILLSKPPYDLLMLRVVNPRIRELPPLENKELSLPCIQKKFLFLDFFYNLAYVSASLMRGTHSTYPKGGVSCSKDSFVVNQTLVFQIKFCGKSPALRVAAKRYRQPNHDTNA